MNLGELHTFVKDECKRGASLDSIIPLRVSMAASMLERNYTMQYMKQTVEITLNILDTQPRLITQPTDIKSIGWLRTIDTQTNLYKKLKLINPNDLAFLDSGLPSGYWLSGRSVIVLDKIPLANYVLEGYFKFFTDWPTDTDATPWLCSRASDVLAAQTMILIGNYLRDMQIVTHYRGWRDECLKTLFNSEQEIEYDGLDTEMAYAPHYGLPDTVLS